MSESDHRAHRRPAFFTESALEAHGPAYDPTEQIHVAHETALALVHAGRAAADPAVTQKLVALVDDIGLSTLAELWSQRPPRSLPGALWRLYVLREWVQRDAVAAAHDFSTGRAAAPVPNVIAGVAEPPTPEALRMLLDAVLHGVFAGDLAVALERAGAFCRVVVAGRVTRADDVEPADPEAAHALTRSSSSLLQTAEDLEAAAVLWRG